MPARPRTQRAQNNPPGIRVPLHAQGIRRPIPLRTRLELDPRDLLHQLVRPAPSALVAVVLWMLIPAQGAQLHTRVHPRRDPR